jgi:putative CocE/NonD family hydrolase
VSEPGAAVRWVRGVRVPMSDGLTLAADLFMPPGDGPFPALLEYLPYRKNDTSWQGYWGHRYLAERGFASARIDVRGTGDSEGTALDEYCQQEQLDGVAAIAWLAAQPWCTGRVGMWGTSYGGFNALQVAMHRPPALGAISPMYFTDRRYTDDCHYKGGALQMFYDVGTYGLAMVGRNLLPPRPDLTGERWAAIWTEHLANEPWLLRWLAHQTEDEQWRQGSLCEDYGAIRCPTFLIGGWRDGYTNCNLRTYQALSCPRKLLIGPWLHVRPHDGVPGPRVNHWRELARFFGHWLRDDDNGVMGEPPIAIYVQRYDPPRADRTETSGFWRHEREWPLARGRELALHLGEGTLQTEPPGAAAPVEVAYAPGLGTTFGIFAAGGPRVLPSDQREEEAFSAVFTGAPLVEPLEIVGRPRVTLRAEATAAVATFVVRLCDVGPDGASALVTKGVLNATHRESHAHPTPLEPGRAYELAIELDATAWLLEPGHRLRLSVSHADFPNSWPSPTLFTSHLHGGTLTLPAVRPQEPALPPPVFEPGEPAGWTEPPDWRVTRDRGRGTIEVRTQSRGAARVDDYAVNETEAEAVALVHEREPSRASMTGRQLVRYRWPGRTIETRTRGQIESDAAAFHVALHVEITVDGMPHVSRSWVRSYARNLL